MEAWQRLLDGEAEEWRLLLREEFTEMSTVTRYYKHGRIELHQGNHWQVWIETDRGIEFLGQAYTLKQAEEMYQEWYEE